MRGKLLPLKYPRENLNLLAGPSPSLLKKQALLMNFLANRNTIILKLDLVALVITNWECARKGTMMG